MDSPFGLSVRESAEGLVHSKTAIADRGTSGLPWPAAPLSSPHSTLNSARLALVSTRRVFRSRIRVNRCRRLR
jgi:hypothetical protein